MPPMAEVMAREQPSKHNDTHEAAGGNGSIPLASLELEEDGGCCQPGCQQLRLNLQEELEASQVHRSSIRISIRPHIAL